MTAESCLAIYLLLAMAMAGYLAWDNVKTGTLWKHNTLAFLGISIVLGLLWPFTLLVMYLETRDAWR